MQQNNKKLVHLKNLDCCQKNSVKYVCSQQRCSQYPFICQKQSCKCQQIHKKCQVVQKLPINTFMTLIESPQLQTQSNKKEFIQSIHTIYQKMIQKLSNERVEFLEAADKFYLGQNTREFIKHTQQQQLNKITGQLIYQIRRQNRNSIIKQLPTKKQIQEKFAPFLNNFYSITDQLAKYTDFTYPILKKSNSKILNAEGQNNIRQFLPKSVKQFKLLYRASQNNFSGRKFHSFCDGADHTLVVVLSSKNTIFGGYTPIPWNTPLTQRKINKFGQQIQDTSEKSFVFSLKYNTKFRLLNKQKAIVHNDSYGPCFGRDIMLSDGCNKNQDSLSVFPSSYGNNTEQDELIGSLCGNGNHFKVTEYQVFKLIWRD